MIGLIRKISKDISNYRFIRNCFKTFAKDHTVKRTFGLTFRSTNFGVLYTVVNIPEQVIGEEEKHHEIVIQKIDDVYEALIYMNLGDIISSDYERINELNTCAYLVKFSPKFQVLGVSFFIKSALFLILAIFLELKFSIFTTLFLLIGKGVEAISNYARS